MIDRRGDIKPCPTPPQCAVVGADPEMIRTGCGLKCRLRKLRRRYVYFDAIVLGDSIDQPMTGVARRIPKRVFRGWIVLRIAHRKQRGRGKALAARRSP